MIYRLTYSNKDGVTARLDIIKGASTPVEVIEGTENPFLLSYELDSSDRSGFFMTSIADISIYESGTFNIDNLKTSSETELKVEYYINETLFWTGFIIPDFFNRNIGSPATVDMVASDRLGTLKSSTLSDLPQYVSMRELAVQCLSRTGLSLPLYTMADFGNNGQTNAFFKALALSERLSDTKGRNISCYDILRSILVACNGKIVQQGGAWYIVNKLQHEQGSGNLFSTLTTSTPYAENTVPFSEVNVGARRTIVPVAATTGVYHEHGGGRPHPENYDFSQGLTGWSEVNGFNAEVENRSIEGYTLEQEPVLRMVPVYGDVTSKNTIRNINPSPGFDPDYDTVPYLKSPDIPVISISEETVDVTINISAIGPHNASLKYVVLATKGTTRLYLNSAGVFEPFSPTNEEHMSRISFGQPGINVASSKSKSITGQLKSPVGYSISVRIYGSSEGNPVFLNFVSISFKNTENIPKGTIYKRNQGTGFTKEHPTDTSIFGDYITTGLNGYFYNYSIDDTSSLFSAPNTLTLPKWTAFNDTEQRPLLQHVTRQRSRMFSVAHNIITAVIDVDTFKPLSIFVDCNSRRYVVVSARFDFFRSSVEVAIEEIAYSSLIVQEFIYSYFGEGETGISSVGGISGGTGTGGGGTGMTPEQLEILNNLSSWWKYDEVNDAIYSDLSVYSKKEVSAYGLGVGSGTGGGGGTGYERLDAWANYDSSKSGWVLSALLGKDLDTRVETNSSSISDLNQRVDAIEGVDSDKNFVHMQGVPSDTWTINHTLNKYPSVTIIDSGGTEVIGNIKYIDTSTVIVTFASGFSGKAILN